jgi:hypothetical protein
MPTCLSGSTTCSKFSLNRALILQVGVNGASALADLLTVWPDMIGKAIGIVPPNHPKVNPAATETNPRFQTVWVFAKNENFFFALKIIFY